jgi:hypothetical protein
VYKPLKKVRNLNLEVLPFIQAAFDLALIKFATYLPPFLSDLQRVVAELCNPDLARRGHPSNKGVAQFRLERYISLFDKLADHVQLELA